MEKGDEGESRLVGVLAEWLKEPSDKTDDAVFMESYIPRTLAEVYDPERDVDVLKRGGGDELIYAGVTGLKLAHESANAKEREKESAGADGGAGVDVDVDVKDEEEGVDESVERSKKGKSKSKDEGGKNKKSTKSVRFEDGVNEQDEEDDAQKAEEGDEEEGMDKKSRGFRHEDRESKKVRRILDSAIPSDHFSLMDRLF